MQDDPVDMWAEVRPGKKSKGLVQKSMTAKRDYIIKLLRRGLWDSSTRQGHEVLINEESFAIQDDDELVVSITVRGPFFNPSAMKELTKNDPAAEAACRGYLQTFDLEGLSQFCKKPAKVTFDGKTFEMKHEKHFVIGPSEASWLRDSAAFAQKRSKCMAVSNHIQWTQYLQAFLPEVADKSQEEFYKHFEVCRSQTKREQKMRRRLNAKHKFSGCLKVFQRVLACCSFLRVFDVDCEEFSKPCPMPWLGLGLAMAFTVAADPKLAVNRWSGCAEVISGSPFPFYFEPCATAEWEVLLDRDGVQLAEEAQEEALQSAAWGASPPSRAKSSVNLSELTADLKLPEAENLLGCTEHKLNFGGSIVLLQRGGCYFSWKVLLAEAAGAGAVLIFDTAPFQVTAILAVPGPFENPRIPGYLISRSQGEELLERLEGGEEIQILCSWSAVHVWFNLPEHSPKSNDSIILHNYGDQEMPWVVDMIDNNASFETDPFYTARVFAPDHATIFNETEMKNITVFNSSAALDDDFHLLKLPFRFPHYLQFKDKVFVSANGVLVFDRVFSNIVGSIADSVAPAALIAPLWADLFGGAVTGQGDSQRLVLRFEGFWLKPGLLTEPSGPFTFELWLFDDGEIHIHWETFPHSHSWLELVEIGLEPGSGAKALPLNASFKAAVKDTPGTPPFSAVLVPWVKLSRSTDALPPNEFLTLNMTLSPKDPSESTAWLFFYARKSLGTWHPRRNVRLLQRTFRHVWVLSGWDGGLHSGSCANATNGLVRHRTRRCVGSDGAEYDESYCIGSCQDITADSSFDYPLRHVWKDGYNNRCEDYRALSFCNETGYGPKWQSWWGRFEDWVSGGPGAGEACCLCGGGRVSAASGASGASGAPVLSEKCPSVKCPVNSVGIDVLSGCSCQAGFEGEVIPSDQSPYYRGQCSPVACPIHSFGEHVADGCVCDVGYIGSIVPSKAEPFFTGSCREAATSASSTSTSKRSSTSSTSSTVMATSRTGTRTSTDSTTSMHLLHGFTTRTTKGIPYTSARHETVSSTTSTISTSTQSTARTTYMPYMGTFPERRSVQVSATTTTSESPLSTIDFWTSTSFTSFTSFTLFTSSSFSTSSTDASNTLEALANSPTSESKTSTEANLPFPAVLHNSTQTKSSTGTTISVGNRSTSSTPTTSTTSSRVNPQTHPGLNSSTYTPQSTTQSQTSTPTLSAGFSVFTTSTSSTGSTTSTTFQTFTTQVEAMELVSETGAANVELSGAYEPPKAAFASTSRKGHKAELV
eukprot:s206_g42.t1